MKKYFIIASVLVVIGLLFCSPVLADNPPIFPDPLLPPITTTDGSSTDVSVSVNSGGDVNANINLTGSSIDVSVNGAGLATDKDIQNLGKSQGMSNFYYSQTIQKQQDSIQGLIDELTQLKDGRIAIDENAIAKLIIELQSTQSNLRDARDQIDNVSNIMDNNTQKTMQIQDSLGKQISDASTQIETVQSLLDAYKGDSNIRLDNLEQSFATQQSQIDNLTQENKSLQNNLSNMKMGVIIGLIVAITLSVSSIFAWRKSAGFK